MTDDDDSLADFEKAILKKVYLWLMVGGVAIGGVGGSGILRVNKFTDKDAQILKAEILEHVDKEFKAEELDCLNFRREINKRITSLEWRSETMMKFITDHRQNVDMFYDHKHRGDDGSVVVHKRHSTD